MSTEVYREFVALVERLRRECPWDREQTHDSIKHLLIEETYEAVSAIDRADWDELKKELGDLFLHVVFHSVIAAEQGTFTLEEVIALETEKLIRRHPHVFGNAEVSGTEEVLTNWEMIKQQEHRGTPRSALAGVPTALPSLLRAQRIQEKAAGVGFDFPEAEDAWTKVEEEWQEFREEIQHPAADPAKIEEEFGDVLFALVNYARFKNVTPENALRRTNDKFSARFAYIEAELAKVGRSVHEATLAEMDQYWEVAKRLSKKDLENP